MRTNKSIQKSPLNKRKRDVRRAAIVVDTAEVVGVSRSEVQKVLRGDRNNDTVIAVYMEIHEGKNRLLEEVKKLLPEL